MSKLSTRRPKSWMRTCPVRAPFAPPPLSEVLLRKSHFRWQTESKKLRKNDGKVEQRKIRGAVAEIKVSARVAPVPRVVVCAQSCVPERMNGCGSPARVPFCTYRSTLLGQPKAGNILATCSLVLAHSIFYVAYSFRVPRFSRIHKKRFRLLGCISIECISVNRPPR